jgi:NitT/TauT family transport system permease protein
MLPDAKPAKTGNSLTRTQRALRVILPLAVAAAVLLVWTAAVRLTGTPPYVLPAPAAIGATLIADGPSLLASGWVTLRMTLEAFALALASGFALGVLFARSRLFELSFAPYAVILQVTPIVAIAPLIRIWVGVDRPELAIVILAWIVAFFPILSSTTLGLRSTDPYLRDLFALYGAGSLQRLIRLELPSALPSLMSGIKVAAGLALIGSVVAEFVAGSGATTGLAWRISEAGNRLEIARMFAALGLLSLIGIGLFFGLSVLEQRLLGRWHASARLPEG